MGFLRDLVSVLLYFHMCALIYSSSNVTKKKDPHELFPGLTSDGSRVSDVRFFCFSSSVCYSELNSSGFRTVGRLLHLLNDFKKKNKGNLV